MDTRFKDNQMIKDLSNHSLVKEYLRLTKKILKLRLTGHTTEKVEDTFANDCDDVWYKMTTDETDYVNKAVLVMPEYIKWLNKREVTRYHNYVP